MAIAPIEYVELDGNGVARVAGTPYKVIELIADYQAHGSPVERMRPRFAELTLAQIHAAFAYYYDHQSELDAQLHDESTIENDVERQSRILAADRAVWLREVHRLRGKHPGKCAVIANGRLLGVADTLAEAQALVERLEPPPELYLVFFVDQDPVFEPYYDTFAEYF
jgi:uncharacterized protein (DUF433 family)